MAEALMSFGIQGPKGDTGARGPRGATGPQGPSGTGGAVRGVAISGVSALSGVLYCILLDYEDFTQIRILNRGQWAWTSDRGNASWGISNGSPSGTHNVTITLSTNGLCTKTGYTSASGIAFLAN